MVTGFGILWGKERLRKWEEKHQWNVDWEAGTADDESQKVASSSD
jgi:hypothetical protein